MPVGDLMELRAKYNFEGNEGMIVCHFRIAAVTVGAVNQLADRWLVAVQPAIAALQSEETYLQNLFVRNVFDPSAYVDRVYSSTQYPGARTAVSTPPFIAVGYKAQRDRLDVRNGYKRIPFPGSDVIEEESYAPTASVALETLRSALSATLVSVNGNQYTPIVVKRIKYTTPGGEIAYKLPENQAQMIYFLSTYALQPYVTTQNTRKVGR